MDAFKDKTIAITGAASGIGLATAHLLASKGAKISLADVREESLKSACVSIQEANSTVQILTQVVDVTKRQEIDRWLDATVEKFGKLDGAANLAGIIGAYPFKSTQELEDNEWDDVLNVNLKGVFMCVRGELLRIKDEGSIVNAASVAGLIALPNGAPYSASKARHMVTLPTRFLANNKCSMPLLV